MSKISVTMDTCCARIDSSHHLVMGAREGESKLTWVMFCVKGDNGCKWWNWWHTQDEVMCPTQVCVCSQVKYIGLLWFQPQLCHVWKRQVHPWMRKDCVDWGGDEGFIHKECACWTTHECKLIENAGYICLSVQGASTMFLVISGNHFSRDWHCAVILRCERCQQWELNIMVWKWENRRRVDIHISNHP